jgi:Tol biopolymer transport system component/tRNA A-37 threonylcarbamoyl transferase component Bud32
MALTPGTKLGPYEILAPLGQGGMGEVFRARDPRLGREVAIKALPDAFAQDSERLARFEREARLLASLNHPNVAGIHGLEEVEGHRYLVLEFVEGETLATRIARGALPVDEAFEVCRQVAAGVEAAHETGIVHRDLKPGNVMLTPSGAVKVLDFGLARSAVPAGSGSDANLSVSPTMTHAATEAGVILGTAAYMSPEQARGKAVDRRTDIWSFGCVLFECLAGRPIFTGETVSDLVAQILKGEPDWSALPPGTPATVRRLLERCLRKDPRERLRDIGDARLELGEADDATPAARPGPGRRLRIAAAALAGVVLVATLAIGAWTALQRPRRLPGIREASVMLPLGQRLATVGSNHFLALSPDGRSIAFMARTAGEVQLHVRALDRREDIAIPGTSDARDPFFSPDGEWVAFFDSQQLQKVSVRGGAPIRLAASTQDRGGVWLDDGSIVFSPDAIRPLYRRPRAGSAPGALTQLDSTRLERTHRWPDALDGGPWVVFTVGVQNSPGDYDTADIDAVSVASGERRNLIHGARRAMWAAPNHLVFDRKGTLFAVRLDPRDPRVKEEPVPVLEGVAGVGSSGAAHLGFARDGSLAWAPSDNGDTQRQVGWFDRAGRWTPTAVPPGEYRSVVISPDGASALMVVGSGGGAGDVWLADLATGGLRRLTYSNTTNSVTWLADGSGIAYSIIDSLGANHLAVRRIDAAGGTRVVGPIGANGVVTAVSSDGKAVVYADWGTANGRIHMTTLGADPVSVSLPTDAPEGSYEQGGALSPDGQWLAYISNRTGREEVFVRRRDGASGQWQVSTHGAGGVRWGRGGTELFFVEDEMLKSVRLAVKGNDLVPEPPVALFEPPTSPTELTFRDYSYDPKSDRFLFTRPPAGTDERREIALSIGWGARIAELIRARGEKR